MPAGTLTAPRSLADVKDEPVDFDGVEVLETGQFNAALGGNVTFTPAMLAELARTWDETGDNFQAPIKLGHDGTGTDGEPARGWVHNLRVVGSKLVADLKAVPADIARKIITGEYRKRSAEVRGNYTIAGKKYPLAFTGLALLGASPPAVDTLADVPSKYFARKFGDAELLLCFASGNTNPPRELRFCAAASLENGMDPKAQLDELMKIMGVSSFEELKTAIGAMAAKGSGAGAPAINAARESDLVAKLAKADEITANLTARVLTMETAAAKAAAEVTVDGLIALGKLVPAQRADAIDLALKSPAGFAKFAAAAKPVLEFGERGATPPGDAGAAAKLVATQGEKEIALAMGKDPESAEWRLAHAKHKAGALGLRMNDAELKTAVGIA